MSPALLTKLRIWAKSVGPLLLQLLHWTKLTGGRRPCAFTHLRMRTGVLRMKVRRRAKRPMLALTPAPNAAMAIAAAIWAPWRASELLGPDNRDFGERLD